MVAIHNHSLLKDSDTEIFSEYLRTNDQGLLADLYHKHERALLSYLKMKIGSIELAEEALIDTWTKLTKCSSQFDSTRSFQGYLYRIATNAANDIFRREKRHAQVISLDKEFECNQNGEISNLASQIPSKEKDPAEIASEKEDYLRIENSMLKLNDYEREYLNARFTQCKVLSEIDPKTPLPTVKNRIKGAINKIRKDLGEFPEEDKESSDMQKIKEARRIESVAELLPERDRIILINRLVHGMKLNEIAEAMDLGLQVTKGILYRAIRQLKKLRPESTNQN